MVVFVHFRYYLHSSIDPDEITFYLYKGYLWVDFFFILSGFVMAYVYDIEHPKRYTMRDALHYLIARIARIYPLHFITLLATVLFYVVGTDQLGIERRSLLLVRQFLAHSPITGRQSASDPLVGNV